MVVFVVASVGRGVNSNGLRVEVVVGGLVVVVDFLVVGRGPLVGTVGTSGVVVVLGGGLEVVKVASGLKPGGSSPDRSSRMTGTAGETRKPSINTPDLDGGGVGVVCSSSGMLAAFETVFTLIAGPWEGVGLSVPSCPADDDDDDDDGRSLRRGVPRLPLKDGEGVGVLRPPVPARRLSFLRL